LNRGSSVERYDRIDLREVMIQTFIHAVEEGVNLAVVVGDSTSTSKIGPFQEKYPDRVINVGIAEQNLVGVAVGLSLGGFVAVTANAAPFLIARSNEQVKNDVCYTETNVKLLGLNAGVCYGPLASTHHAIDDLSIMQGLGNILILAPSDPVETEQILRFALSYRGPVYVRMDSGKFPILHNGRYRFEPGAVDVLKKGSDVTLVAVGSVVYEAFFAAAELERQGISAEVLNVSSIRPLQRRVIVESIRRTKATVTVEEHSLHGGLGSLVSEIIAEEQLSARIMRLGLTKGEFSKAGPREEIRAYYRIDQRGIVNSVEKLIGGSGTVRKGEDEQVQAL
jgi:transketolase